MERDIKMKAKSMFLGFVIGCSFNTPEAKRNESGKSTLQISERGGDIPNPTLNRIIPLVN